MIAEVEDGFIVAKVKPSRRGTAASRCDLKGGGFASSTFSTSNPLSHTFYLVFGVHSGVVSQKDVVLRYAK